MRMYLLPTASFFAMTEARSCGSGSRLTILSTWIILSSAGANPREPPQARQAFVLFTISLSFCIGKSIFAIDSITSAVPAAEVIARDEVFGIVIPKAAQIDTTMGVVLFPATPPIECLSAIFLEFQVIFAPVL